MRFNATKCYILSVKKKTNYFYQLNDTILKEVDKNPYLGISITNDLKWSNHINNICKKASSTLGFIRRNLRHSPAKCRKTAYISLVRSTLEYGAVIWDPFLKTDIEKIEKIQKRAARFITVDYKSRERGCVSRMLKDLELPELQERRKQLRLIFLYKIVEGLTPAIPPADYLKPIEVKRRIRATRYTGFETSNIVTAHEKNNSRCFANPPAKTQVYRNSFFVKTIREWNQLDETIVTAPSADAFKSRLVRD